MSATPSPTADDLPPLPNAAFTYERQPGGGSEPERIGAFTADQMRAYAKAARASLAAPPAPAPQPDPSAPVQAAPWPDVDELAQHIRWLNGSNKMGAGALAERLLDWLQSRGAPVQAAPLTDAARDVLAERRRQVEAEGWTPEHDDQHGDGSMALAAACYAAADPDGRAEAPPLWPWDQEWWKSGDERRNLVKAGALILAEIERLDRAALAAADAAQAAPVQSVPLTYEQRDALWAAYRQRFNLDDPTDEKWRAFHEGVEAGERAHGITGDKHG